MIDLLVRRDINLKNEILSGLTVAFLVPEAIAFAFVAGVDPSVGSMGRLLCWLHYFRLRRPPRNDFRRNRAMAVVMTAFVVLYGIEYLCCCHSLWSDPDSLWQYAWRWKIRAAPAASGHARFRKRPCNRYWPASFKQLQDNHTVKFNELTQSFDIVGSWLTGETLIFTSIDHPDHGIIHYLPKLTKAVAQVRL